MIMDESQAWKMSIQLSILFQVVKVIVNSDKNFGDHFCSEVNSLEVIVKMSKEHQEQ